MKKKWIKRTILGLIIFGAFFGYYKYQNRDGVKTIQIKKVEIQKKQVIKTVSASGEIKSNKEASLSFNATGRILSVNVKKNDIVKKGQLIAQLDNTSVYQTIQSYKDSRDMAILEKDLFVEQYDENRKATGGGTEYDIKLRKLNEAVSQAEANYKGSVSTATNTYIYAPFDGTIIDVTKENGETATNSEMVAKIADLNNVMFEIALDQEDYGFVKTDQKIEVTLDAFDAVSLNGKIKTLPLYANGGSTSNFKIEIYLDTQKDIPTLLGMTGDAKITVQDSEKETDALMYDEVFFDNDNNPYVWVVNNNLIEKQAIEIGIEGDVYTQILTKIDKPIIVGLNNDVEIKEGYKANIMK